MIIERTLAALQKSGEVRARADVATVAAVLGATWLGLMKLQVDQCLEIDLAKAIRFGFAAVIDAIRA